MIAGRRREEKCPKDLQRSQKNNKACKADFMYRGAVEHGRAAEQHAHLQSKGRAAIIPQPESHLVHTVIERQIGSMHDQVENPMEKYSRSQNQTRSPAAK